ncbi:MAG: hypothetical protein IH596_15140 [Bacteroidales bacterium]|nr:hypothetical protein [Bacteroidales bacterium]
MKRSLSLLILIFAALVGNTQNLVSDSLPQSMTVNQDGTLTTPPGRMQTNVIVGTQFSTSSWFGSGLTTFISPSVSYRVTPKFSVRGGLTISNTALFGYKPWFTAEGSPTYDANFTKAVLYLEGSYRVTDRLTISGAGFKEFTITDNSNFYNPYSKNEPYGIYLNADYKIAEGAHIQLGFGYTRGYSNYMGSPMYDPSPFSRGSFSHSPFQRDPFNNRPFGW